jgi:hypothetical protein
MSGFNYYPFLWTNYTPALLSLGLHVDDVLVETVDVQVAVSRLPQDQLLAR